ncbi:MAG: methyltransferase domain-containing protein [Variibacter sp.]
MLLSPLFLSSGEVIADRRYQHALDFRARGDLGAAADLLEQALELAPRFAAAWFTLGEVRETEGDQARAADAFERALAADAADRHGAALHLARLRGASPAAMPPAYVRSLFDQYAPLFEGALVDQLRYRGPALLREALGAHQARAGRPMHFGRVADLGCGTGLVAHAFAGLYDTIAGVDLSPGMIVEARRKGLYAELVAGDMLAFLQGRAPGSVGLVIAADAFVYVGDLALLCAAAARALAADGVLAFTVEALEGEGFALGEKLRYAHSRVHITAALGEAGFGDVTVEEASTRIEGGAPVPGFVVVAST